MSVESRSFVRKDVAILVTTAVYFGITYRGINPEYSSGYESIRTFFIFESLLSAVFQLLLIYSDIKGSKTWILSLRSGAFFFVMGMSTIIVFLGLFSLQLILFVSVVGYLHLSLFL